MTDRRRIVAMGGGGYSTEPDNPLLDRFLVRLAARRRARPTVCPHDGEEQRRPTYRRLVAAGFPPGYAADDGAALVFTGTELTEVVTSRPGARAFRVERTDSGVVETTLPTRFLGAGAGAGDSR